jgi:hypothetical protein
MPNHVISVSTFDTVDVKEDQKNEFKTSIFIDPETNAPGVKQMVRIAKTLAAFMNAEGGRLYVGVADNKQIRGIADDLAILANSPAGVAVHTVRYNDDGFTYGATEDKYELKIRAIARAFLSPNAAACIKSVLVRPMGGKPVCRIELKPCKPDEFVYFFRKYGQSHVEVEGIYVRTGNQNTKLDGAARDEFVRKRVAAGFDSQLASVRASMAAAGAGAHGYAAVMDSVRELLERLDRQRIVGQDVVVTGAQPLDEEHLKPMGKPKGVVFDGAHLCDVKSWKEVFRAVYIKLNEISAATFDSLPETESKWFKRAKRCTGCYGEKFGTTNDVRAVEMSNKAYLWNENYFLRKLMSACGVDASRFMIRA